jgi:N-methylhydantoinase A/oxoprolinase/acetone carboxylase beta subunit
MSLGLGLDTGGTYTDAVILDLKSGQVLQKAKALTTREDLVIGIGNALKDFDKKLLKQVSMVSLSSTLATNSIVEGKGCRVGLICIGREFDNSIKTDQYVMVRGRHDINGNEVEQLDRDAIVDFLEKTKDALDCYAVTGYMAVRNPDHEIAVREIVTAMTCKPVVCGYQLSSVLGFNERAVTAVMNARLIPLISDLIDSVKKVMSREEIYAPIMIVKGDGSIMNVKVAKERPVETILCGPAASLTGAKALTGLNDAVVVDMGGTTTDIGILRNGFPAINTEGAMIGNHRTHVMAAEISTSGIGGDSRILLNGTRLSLTPLRVIPLCLAASMWPEVLDDLREALNVPIVRYESADENNVVSDIEFFTASKPAAAGFLSSLDTELLALLKYRPLSLRRAGAILNVHPIKFNIKKMEEHGLIRRIGLTPTDILHSEGSYVEYDRDASVYGVAYVSKRLGMAEDRLIAKVKEMVHEKICLEILNKVIFDETGSMSNNAISNDLLYKSITGRMGRDYACSLTINKPIVGIGAPVDAWLPEVSKKLNTQFISAENSHVGNAIGAISGCIIESIDILLEPDEMSKNNNNKFTAYSKLGKVSFKSLDEGIDYAKIEGGRFAETSAMMAGASSVNITYDIKEKTFDLNGSKAIIDVTVSVVATGKPMQMV